MNGLTGFHYTYSCFHEYQNTGSTNSSRTMHHNGVIGFGESVFSDSTNKFQKVTAIGGHLVIRP